MESKVASADEGWHWYVRAWELFKKEPGTLVGQLLILLILAVASNLIPLVGGPILALATPVLAGGWYYSIRRLDDDKEIRAGDVFEGFRNKEWTTPLLVLGGVVLVTDILMDITVSITMGGTSMATVLTMAEAGAMHLPVGLGVLLALCILLLLAAVVFTAMFYAIPLVIFQKFQPVEAMKNSVMASLHNWLSLLVFGLVYLVLAIIAAIPLGLGFLVLIPVSVCAAYCSYKTIFE